jgi:hypothetical protein
LKEIQPAFGNLNQPNSTSPSPVTTYNATPPCGCLDIGYDSVRKILIFSIKFKKRVFKSHFLKNIFTEIFNQKNQLLNSYKF